MHDCDVMINIGARFDDRVTGRLAAFSPNSKKIHVDIDPSSINKNVRVDLPIVGDVAHVLEDMIKALEGAGSRGRTRRRSTPGGSRSTAGAARDCLQLPRTRDTIIKPQYALQRLYARDQGQATSTSPPKSASTRCGRRSSQVREAEPLDDLGRARHHGLWPAGRDRRADRASGRAGHRHRRRGLDPDEHPGDVDGRAVPAAGQGVHPQQPVYGHGPPVAGAAAWRAAIPKATRSRCPIS